MKNDKMKYNKRKRKYNVRRITFIIIIMLVIIIILKLGFEMIKKTSTQVLATSRDNISNASFPIEVFGVMVNTQLISEGTSARPGTKRKIEYVIIHETDNFAKGTGAKNHAEYLSKNNTDATSWHYTVDDKEIYHHIPDNEVANHSATQEGNLYGIGVELCVNKDGNFNQTFENATKLVAYLLKEYNLSSKDIKTHHDFSGKDCPHSILRDNRMEEFITKVEKLL